MQSFAFSQIYNKSLTAEQYDGLAGKLESLQLSIYEEKLYSLSVVMAAMSIYLFTLINIFFPFREFFFETYPCNISNFEGQFTKPICRFF